MVNNEPRNVPQEILDAPRSKLKFIGYLGYQKDFAAHGGQNFEWDPQSEDLASGLGE